MDRESGYINVPKDPPKKRVRKSRSKGLRCKTGCLTCRKRHKKCDERLPICGPCSISKRECLYAYAADPAAAASVSSKSTVVSFTTKAEASVTPAGAEQTPASGSTSAATAGRSPHAIYPSPVEASQASGSIPLGDASQYAFSPDTVTSELLTADLASTRWLDLLATDAAQADSSFSLAPSPAPIEDSGYDEPRPGGAAAQIGPELPVVPDLTPAVVSERHAWQADQDIILTDREAAMFRTFTERTALWLDLFDPLNHFSNYAIRLALRNPGLMKAILALAARHNATIQASLGAASETDFSEAVQYYYETLHYVQTALQYNTYAHSEELLATVLAISSYEMLDASDSNWKRHLKGVFWIQRSQDVNGASGGLRQTVWWAWLRQDLWAAFRERRRCFSFWRPDKDYSQLTQDELATRAVYLLSQSVNFCAKFDTPAPGPEMAAKRAAAGEALMNELERWKTFLGSRFQPLPTVADPNSAFQPLWVHPPHYGVALQVYSFARILVTLHRPAVFGFGGYLKTQRTLSDAVATICGIAMELKDESCQIMSAQCLFGAGLCVQDDIKRNAIISLIDACEARTGWPMATLRSDLRAEWSKTI
ncbi:hypothetical protein BX600DRAFT_447820 [Xylariales sp. PMI_506]|nr:hypothetical protein BX600DRAFT_447820 [Xylariales sp. PMI_506]